MFGSGEPCEIRVSNARRALCELLTAVLLGHEEGNFYGDSEAKDGQYDQRDEPASKRHGPLPIR